MIALCSRFFHFLYLYTDTSFQTWFLGFDILLKICDKLIGGLMAGIPACYTAARVRQRSVKAKRCYSKTYCELCCCYIRVIPRITGIAFRSCLSQENKLHSQHLKHFYVLISVLENSLIILIIISLYCLGNEVCV